jgi:hypothetical protein
MRSVIECRQRAKGQRPLDAAFDRLMMDAKAASHRIERRRLAVGQQHSRSLNPARLLAARPRKGRQIFNLPSTHRQLDRLPPSSHLTTPRLARHKRGIPQQPICSVIANFMESVV